MILDAILDLVVIVAWQRGPSVRRNVDPDMLPIPMSIIHALFLICTATGMAT